MKLTLFDLDHTLLSGDSDVLWCNFLIAKGILRRAEFASRNADMEARYKAGTVGADEFAAFYISTLAGRSARQWEPLRQEFLLLQIIPRIPRLAAELVQRHIDQGDLVILTTATNRFITELTAIYLGIEHLIATEAQTQDGIFTGRPIGTLNMRSGKVDRLHQWLHARGYQLGQFSTTAYSDSVNDLPLLELVQHPVAVDPDPQLSAVAAQRIWPTLHLR